MREGKQRLSARSGRILGWATAAGALCTVFLMASSASAAPAISFTGPWGKALVTPANVIVELQGCATATGKSATFSKKTGLALWQGTASAKTCKGPLGKGIESVAINQNAVGITYPIRAPAGTNSVTVNVSWNISASASYSLKYGGTCPAAVYNASMGYGYEDCVAEAITQFIGSAEVIDLTTGAISYASSTSGAYPAFAYKYVENYSFCYNATYCTYSNYSAFTPWTSQNTTSVYNMSISLSMTSADKYAVYTYVGGDFAMDFDVYHGSASGTFNMATGGNGAKLVSITET